jgi:HrpA-like RNA helicase
MIRDLGAVIDRYPDQLLAPTIPDQQQSFERWEQQLGNEQLPISAHKEEIIDSLVNSPVTILMAETGAGKSTQAAQYALEAGFENITITQPRRRAAINVSERIHVELSDKLGEIEANRLVSCQTGAGLEGLRDSKIRVVTDGLHLIRDGHDMEGQPRELWIIDEFHEANCNIELLVALGKEKLAINPNFRMLIMSATMEKEKLADYFTTADGTRPPVLEIEGHMYDVEHRQAPESTVAKEIVKAAAEITANPSAYDNANTIQVFVAGTQEIKDTIELLHSTLPQNVLQQAHIFGLHAKMSEPSQAPAYEDVEGIKIIVQTKMGQTSMTIPRTRYVISSGMERRNELDDEVNPNPGLMLRPCTQDDLTQQAGRTGRTSEGIFVLTKMDSHSSFIGWDKRDLRPAPEIQNSDIDKSTLFMAAIHRDIAHLDTYNDIDPIIIEHSKHRLYVLGALDASGTITAKGKAMNFYPAAPSSSASMYEVEKLPLLIRNFMAAIVAAKEAGGVRLFGRDVTKRWEGLTQETTSDSLADLDLFVAIQDMTYEEMAEYDLDVNNIIRAREQYRKIAKQAGADPNLKLGVPKEDERQLLREAILAGSINKIYLPIGEGRYRLLGKSAIRREISNRSVVFGSNSPMVGEPRRVAIVRAGVPEIKQIIEEPTEVSLAAIGRIATHLTKWEPSRFVIGRNGQWMQEERHALDIYTLDTRLRPAVPSPLLRSAIMEHVKLNPGKHLAGLYTVKSTLEKLAHKAKGPVNQLTQDQINVLIDEATPADISDPSFIEDNLRKLIADKNIRLDDFVSSERQARIINDAPPSITVRDISFGLRYVKGKPIAKKWTFDKIQNAPDDLALGDYRQIYFNYGEGLYSLPQLKKILRDQRLIW